MNFLPHISVSMILLVFLLPAGCERRPTVEDKPKAKVAAVEADPFRSVLDTFRYPENPRSSDDWTRFREGFAQIAAHFARPEVAAQLHLSPADRKVLESQVHLTEEELSELDATTFRTADAHYLDECFLMRDAARYLEVEGLDSIEQANLHFRWTMRNVYLHEQGDTWIPPAMTLRRGFGSALERSLVFLALLRQSQIEGCLIVSPEAKPNQVLVGVLDAKTSNLHLFDPRLGLALWGPDGKTIASLNEALSDPKILAPSLISADDAARLQTRLVCPFYALSPRMALLQENLGKHDTIVLHLNTGQLIREITSASKLPVQVWNGPMADGKLPNSPTRCLRMFLPKQEGGLDETKRASLLARNRLPYDQVITNYAQVNVHPELMSQQAFNTLMAITSDLFEKYELQTRELYLRGLQEPVLRRHERLQAFARSDTLVGLTGDAQFREELANWLKQVRAVDAEIQQQRDPRALAKAQKEAQALLYQDPFLSWLMNIENEEKLDREHKKSILTGILAVGMREHFDLALARSQASFNHEKAERSQSRLLPIARPSKSALNKVHEAWSRTRNSWSTFYIDRIALDLTITQRLDQARRYVHPSDVLRRLGLLESLHREIHRYFEAKLRLAECFERLDDPKAARTLLERTRGEIDSLEKKDLLQREIKGLRDSVPAQLALHLYPRIDLLATDWSERGSFFWLKQQIDQKLANRLKG